MSDVELVIKIPKSIYNYVKQLGNIPTIDTQCVANAIFDGTPLPKGHGALKDVDNIKTAFPSGEYVRTESVRATIDHEDTVVQAESGVE